MDLAIKIVLLLLGFVLLIKGADVMIDAAVGIAQKLNVPDIVIGLTIVAFGTSAPEAAISIQSAIAHQAELSIGNVLGSNIMNIFLILGVTAVIVPIHLKSNTVKIEIPFVILSTIVFTYCGLKGNSMHHVDGVILLGLLSVFMIYTLIQARKGQAEELDDVKIRPLPLMLLLLVLGFILLIAGSNLIVDNASYLAAYFGMSSRLIGLTIVAFGTSLPELVASLTAARKGNSDMAIGNVVGSNVFNLLFIIGTVSIISPIPFSESFLIDAIVALAAAVLLFLCTLRKKEISRLTGILFLLCYFAYTAYLIVMR